MPKLISVILLAALALTGCSDGPSLDGVAVQGTGAATTVKVPAKFAVTSSVTKVLKKGTGAKIATGDSVKVNYVAVNGRTGKVFDNSFKTDKPYSVQLSKGKALPGFVSALVGQKVGARLLTAIAPIDGFAQDRADFDLLKSDTMVFYLVVESKAAAKATGKAAPLPADVPSIVLTSGEPSGFKATASTPPTLAAASAHVTIKGTGAKVPAGGTVVAHYVGQVYPAGAVFDSSWKRGEPATFSLEQVIPCWKNLLPGVRIGSRVVLECPAADAYADAPPPNSGIKPGDSLLFAVDVLDAY